MNGFWQALNTSLGWAYEAWKRRTAARDAVLVKKADIDKRHHEERDLSKDTRPKP